MVNYIVNYRHFIIQQISRTHSCCINSISFQQLPIPSSLPCSGKHHPTILLSISMHMIWKESCSACPSEINSTELINPRNSFVDSNFCIDNHGTCNLAHFYFFLSNVLFISFFYCVIISSTMPSKCGQCRYPCLLPHDHGKVFSISTLSMEITSVFSFNIF